MSSGQLFLVSAPSGAGKTSLVEAALAVEDNLVVSVSHTTRKRRSNEQDGVDYHFVDQPTFKGMIERGEFLEHAQVFRNQYGTGRRQVADLLAAGRDVILEIDWQGADQVRALVEDAIAVFILPPDEETLAARLRGRGQDSEETIQERLAEARLDISQAPRYDYIVVNDVFEDALKDLICVFRSRPAHLSADQQTRNNAKVIDLLSS